MATWYEMEIRPRDILFFGAARPMTGSALGEGANWPMPSVFNQAILSALQENWPEMQAWEHDHRAGPNDGDVRSFRFGGLRSVGVFPEREELYFPMPSDIRFRRDASNHLCPLEPRRLRGMGNLPPPLEMGLFGPADSGPKDSETAKRSPNRWISFSDLLKYLAGEPLEHRKLEPFFDAEIRPGLGIDPQTGAAEIGGGDQGGSFHLAEYMRLGEGVVLKAFAACEQLRYRDETAPVDVLDRFFDEGEVPFVFGGQRGLAFLGGIRDSQRAEELLNPAPMGSGRRLKWVTLTPSIFTGGWLPSWIDRDTGSITASEVTRPERRPGYDRKAWRSRFGKNPVPGRLVAASIPKAIPYSGWSDRRGPRPTRLCVPAGAVYYFEVPEGEDPDALIRFLNGKRKSDMAAEKGFGFGLCGVWREFGTRDSIPSEILKSPEQTLKERKQ